MTRKAYELTYKISPKARKTYTAIQFHFNADTAISDGQKYIRAYSPEAVVLSAIARPDVDSEIEAGRM